MRRNGWPAAASRLASTRRAQPLPILKSRAAWTIAANCAPAPRITDVSTTPTLVKSRPIGAENAQATLFPLNKFRHFHFPPDPVSWAEKKPHAVWRGRLHNEARRVLVTQFHGHHSMDIGYVGGGGGLAGKKPWLTHREQLNSRYIVSIEGRDVATNLKWVMGSNSLALSPALAYETWFMEGALEPGIHFVELAADLSDLPEKLDWAESNPKAVQQIIKNAQDWCAQFKDPKREALVATLVLQKYLEMSGVLPNADFPGRLFS